ncbi:MAG: hypothetical protein ACRC8Y_02505 [Chroococcales cyanobacterium]
MSRGKQKAIACRKIGDRFSGIWGDRFLGFGAIALSQNPETNLALDIAKRLSPPALHHLK